MKHKIAEGTLWILFSAFIALFVVGCGGGGGGSAPPVTGPGDTGNNFPLTVGNTWIFQGTITETGTAPVSYTNTARITGTKLINGVTTTVLAQSNPGNAGRAIEQYVLKDGNGITNYGDNDPSDTITPQLIPYQEVRFPLVAGSSFDQTKTGLNFGQDLDGDGRNETVTVNLKVVVIGFETVTVQVGSFLNCARIETTTTVTVTLSSNNATVSSIGVATSWYAPGVGLVKSNSVITAVGRRITEDEELVGFSVEGQTRGIQPKFTIAGDVAPADSNEESPGRPSIGFDGTNYLFVSRRVAGTNDKMVGQLVSGSGAIVKTFDISAFTPSYQGASRSSVL